MFFSCDSLGVQHHYGLGAKIKVGDKETLFNAFTSLLNCWLLKKLDMNGVGNWDYCR